MRDVLILWCYQTQQVCTSHYFTHKQCIRRVVIVLMQVVTGLNRAVCIL